MKLLSVDAARARMLAHVRPLATESIALEVGLGRVLAEELRAVRDQPPFAASAMDGWAVRAEDTPARLAIVGESAAGHAFAGSVGKREAARIFTGAPMPAGADAVVIQEDAVRDGESVTVPAVRAGRHVRAAGMDFRAGDELLARGDRLDPWRLALAAAAGRSQLCVSRQPRVAILATGEEIVPPGGVARADQIFDSGSASLAALVSTCGGRPETLGRVGDDEGAIAEMAARAGGDLLVTLGGASVGDHDLVKPALARLGLQLAVESVAVRPGKPTWFGVLADGKLVLGLPGNPASAMVCAELFLRPLLAALQGADPALRLITTRVGGALRANGEREQWLRATLSSLPTGDVVATPLPDQDSSLVMVFAAADCLVRRPPGAAAAEVGDPVEVLPLPRL
ncbi:MAG TPA: gephyrin-like molybdotransferase Glp [Caulobacteraceae bacterium]|nr:gephyrin-like molybdotransferase Glp [Caulobacteraceae bacterium]